MKPSWSFEADVAVFPYSYCEHRFQWKRYVALLHTQIRQKQLNGLFDPTGQNAEPFVAQLATKSDDGNILAVYWQIQHKHCDQFVRVVTLNYTLHPVQFVEDVPIKKGKEYNVTLRSEECLSERGNIFKMNVSLSILLSGHVVEKVPYVLCILSRYWNISDVHVSRRVYLQSFLPSTTTEAQIQSTFSSYSMPSGLMTDESETESVCCAAGQPYQDKVLCLCTLLCLVLLT